MEELQALPQADQDCWLLLHGSLQRGMAHLPRVSLWQHVGQALQRADSEAVNGVFALLGLPRDDAPLTAHITLPHCHARLGLSHTGQCTVAPKPSGRSMASAAMLFTRSGRTCMMVRDPCGDRNFARMAPTAWTPLPRHRANVPALRPDPCRRSDGLLRPRLGHGQPRTRSPSHLRWPSSYGPGGHSPNLVSLRAERSRLASGIALA
jgi:hypothetical protein